MNKHFNPKTYFSAHPISTADFTSNKLDCPNPSLEMDGWMHCVEYWSFDRYIFVRMMVIVILLLGLIARHVGD